MNEMKLFMEPESVAIIGVSRATGPGSLNILENLVDAGFPGRVYPVNPNADEILGVKCYHSVIDIPDAIDLAVISTPRSLVPRIVGECTQKGIRALIVVGQGFADGDEEGKELQSEIVRIARGGGARILGPNTFGIANAFNNLSSAYMKLEMNKVPIGIIAQSGFFFVGLPKFIVVGKGIDLGNACDIDFADGLEYFEGDPQIKLILLHIEGTKNGRRFMEVAGRVAKKKPIIALKTGRGEDGARAARSHSGSLAGRDEVYDAAFRQHGIIRVGDVDEFHDLAKAFLRLPPMKGRGIGVITITGAGGIMATDSCEKHNLHLAKPSAETLSTIGVLAPSWQTLENPADIWPAMMIEGHSFNKVFTITLEAFLADGNIHAVILIFASFPAQFPTFPMGDLSRIADRFDKPVVCWLYGPDPEKLASLIENEGRILVFPTLDRAMRTLSRLNDYFEHVVNGNEGKEESTRQQPIDSGNQND